MPTPQGTLRALPAGVWALGVVSLLMDTSSELVHGLLPVFLASTLGASMVTIGLVEGLAEAVASCTKAFAGALSDRLGTRKGLVVMGYGLAALSKPLFPLASSVGWVVTARFVDRLGKGIRGAPRDALVADITPPELRGAAYGLRQSLDAVGAFCGPLLAIGLMVWFSNDIRAVLWVAVLPAGLAVAVLVVAVTEPAVTVGHAPARGLAMRARLAELPRRYWQVAAVGAVCALARFSEAFLVLRALDVGLAVAFVPAVMIAMNVVYAVAAYPAGLAADRLSAQSLLGIGLAALVCANVVLATATAPLHVFLGTAAWGLHMALTQGMFSKLVASSTSPELRGTAFGIFHFMTGMALLAASLLAGALWSAGGPSATFVAGALLSAAAATCVVTVLGPRDAPPA